MNHIVEPNKMVFTHIDALSIHAMMTGTSIEWLKKDRKSVEGAKRMTLLVRNTANPVQACREMLAVGMIRKTINKRTKR